MTNQTIKINNNKNQKLVGVLNHWPSDVIIIFCHGYTATKDIDGFTHLANSFDKYKISTFRFDFSGSGESIGDKNLSIKQQVADLESVIKYFRSYKHIYLLGHSLGVLPALISSHNSAVDGLITINGFFFGNVYRKDFNRAYQILKILRLFVPRIWQEWRYTKQNIDPKNITKPILLITTKKDDVLDYTQSITFNQRLKRVHSIKILPLTSHGANAEQDGEIISQTTMKWIKV